MHIENNLKRLVDLAHKRSELNDTDISSLNQFLLKIGLYQRGASPQESRNNPSMNPEQNYHNKSSSAMFPQNIEMRRRTLIEEATQTKGWRSQSIQYLMHKLIKINPRTKEWTDHSNSIIREYQAKMADNPKLEEYTATIKSMFEENGEIYNSHVKRIKQNLRVQTQNLKK